MKVREALVILSRMNPDTEVELKFPSGNITYDNETDYGDTPYVSCNNLPRAWIVPR